MIKRIRLWVVGTEGVGEGLMWVVTYTKGHEDYNHRFSSPVEAFKYAGFLSVLFDMPLEVEEGILLGVSNWAW